MRHRFIYIHIHSKVYKNTRISCTAKYFPVFSSFSVKRTHLSCPYRHRVCRVYVLGFRYVLTIPHIVYICKRDLL